MTKSTEARRAYGRAYYLKNKHKYKPTYLLERDDKGRYYNPNPIPLDEADIVNDYCVNLLSTKKIGNKYRVDKSCIRRILLKNNIKLRNKSEVKPLNSNGQSSRWTGYGEVRGCFFSAMRKGAAARNLEFTITIEQIWELFLSQNRKCALSGVDLNFAQNDKDHKAGLTTASLDRKDSKRGYTIDNVQWVHKWVNIMKQDMSDDELIGWCHLISKNKE